MKNIGLLGGSFDPIHLGHTNLAHSLVQSGIVDEVWLCPSGDRPDKQYSMNLSQRLKLINLALQDLNSTRISVEEIQTSGKIDGLSTAALHEYLAATYPANKFHFIIGSDLIASIHTWKNLPYLRENVSFLIIKRPEADAPKNMPDLKTLFVHPHSNWKDLAISSTKIRKLIKAGDFEKLANYLSPRVLTFCCGERCLVNNPG